MTTDIKIEVPEQEEIEEIIYEEELTWVEAINCAFAALSSIDGIDFGMLNPSDQNRILRIRRKSIRLIDAGINEIYEEKFLSNEEEQQ